MSKADTLGRGSSFGSAGNRSARRGAIDQTINGAAGNSAAITDLPVTLVSENPDNPRNHLRALDETTESVREIGVVVPIVVATVEAYLHDRPDRTGDLDDGAQYVVVDGHRRLEASRRVGLATIPVRVDNARVATDESLLETAFVANYHRDDMTELEEAHALKSLVDFYGSQTRASKRLGIPQNTISTKLSLLKLSPELQRDLVDGTRKVEHVRNLSKLDHEAQRRKADERAAVDEEKRERARSGKVLRDSPTAGSLDYHGVIIPEAPAGTPETAGVPEPPEDPPPVAPASTAPLAPPAGPGADTVPGQRPTEASPAASSAEASDAVKNLRMPWDDGVACAEIAIQKMTPAERRRMVERLVREDELAGAGRNG